MNFSGTAAAVCLYATANPVPARAQMAKAELSAAAIHRILGTA
jgi:hypothetical protein